MVYLFGLCSFARDHRTIEPCCARRPCRFAAMTSMELYTVCQVAQKAHTVWTLNMRLSWPALYLNVYLLI